MNLKINNLYLLSFYFLLFISLGVVFLSFLHEMIARKMFYYGLETLKLLQWFMFEEKHHIFKICHKIIRVRNFAVSWR